MGILGLSQLEPALAPLGLIANGGVTPSAQDPVPADVASIVLLSPSPAFWDVFTASPEFQDGDADPLDRWSLRVITALAKTLGAHAFFPFAEGAAGPAPFFAWAARSGAAWPSPVALLAGPAMGLNTSYRGALGLSASLDFIKSAPICDTCAAPCTQACPVAALTESGYDVPACKSYLAAAPDSPCRQAGCLVRRACPATRAQSPAQARFHMDAFLG